MATTYDVIAVIVDKARDHANEARNDRNPATLVLAVHELAAAVSNLAELSEKHEGRLAAVEVARRRQTELASLLDRCQDMQAIIAEANERLVEERNELHIALRFARSAIKSGEPWSETCEEVIDGALAKVKGVPDHA